jgi:uncharacterized protein (TIGR02996 family)
VLLTDSPADRLIEALLGQAGASGADTLTLGWEMHPDDPDRLLSCARCWRDGAVTHEQPLAFDVLGLLTRRIMLLASLDPWQFRRLQSGTLQEMGCWAVEVAGEDANRRRLTLRPLSPEVDERPWAELVRSAVERIDPPAPSLEDLSEGHGESPIVRLVNLILINALKKGAREIRLVGDDRCTVDYGFGDGRWWREMTPPARLWPVVRRRLLIMSGVEPWRPGPGDGSFKLLVGEGRAATFSLELAPPERGDRIRLRVIETSPRECEEGATTASSSTSSLAADPSGLLAGILEHPGDVERRQVYSDWLQERGDPRGEFIARQFAGQLEAVPPPEALGWCGALCQLASAEGMRFCRGFLDRLVATRDPPPAEWEAIVADPHWSTVRALDLGAAQDRLAWRLLREARLGSLEEVVLPPGCMAHLEPLAVLSRLSVLGVSRTLLDDEDVRRALDERALAGLQRLDLWSPSDALWDAFQDLADVEDGEVLARQQPHRTFLRPIPELGIYLSSPPDPTTLRSLARHLQSVQHLHVAMRVGAQRTPFSPSVLWTCRRAPGATLSGVVLHGTATRLLLLAQSPGLLETLALTTGGRPTRLDIVLTGGELTAGQREDLCRRCARAVGGQVEIGPELDAVSWRSFRLITLS